VTSLKKDDVFRAEMPGSGGHGDPVLRDPAAIRSDLALGKITAAHAQEAYGAAGEAESDATPLVASDGTRTEWLPAGPVAEQRHQASRGFQETNR
jgi:N-methylhydantoinase B/oxoprolinase/acetone carboxylase alpha subunit